MERRTRNKKQEPAYFPFVITKDGIWFRKKSEERHRGPVVWRADRSGCHDKGWSGRQLGRLPRWNDHEDASMNGPCQWMHWLANRARCAPGSWLRAPFFTTNARYREKSRNTLDSGRTNNTMCTRVGWHADTYVLPDWCNRLREVVRFYTSLLMTPRIVGT